MHIVSEIEGTLNTNHYSTLDALKASFPAGTLSGAPKIRAMQLIEELEPHNRGLYGGAFGYITFNQECDTCIIIRSVTITKNEALVQAGAGIVFDSDPEKEYQETLHKAQAVLHALDLTDKDN